MKKLILSFGTLAVVATSCQSNARFKDEIATVDSLQTRLSLYDVRMDSVDESRLREISPEVNELYDYLVENYPDSLDRSFWVTQVNGMVIVKKGADKYLSFHDKVQKEIDYTQEQLSSLRKSLTDEKLTEEDAEKYLSDERQAVSEIGMYVNKLQGPAQLAVVMWDTLHPRMRALADSIQALP